MPPTNEDVRLALEKILNSETFAQSDRHKSFLRYITEETLAGRGERIKGYSVAVEVFGKAPDFDAQNDPYVRVEAGRLRKRLAEYYQSEGAGDRVRIALKRGGYSPRFSYQTVESPNRDEQSQRQDNRSNRRGIWLGVGVSAAVLLVVGTLFFQRQAPDVFDAGSGPPTIRIRIFSEINSTDFAFFADGLNSELLIVLRRFESVWGPLNVFPFDDDADETTGFDHDYVLDGTVSRVDGAVHVTARLIDGPTGALVWSRSFDGEFVLAEVVQLQERIASEITNAIREPFGPLADAEVKKIIDIPVDRLSPYQCNVLFLAAVDQLDRSARDDARSCLERHDEDGDLDATGLGALAFLYHLDYDDGVDLIDVTRPGADKAYEIAERAIEKDKQDIVARMAMTFVEIARNEHDEAVASMEELMSLNPPDSTYGIASLLMIKLGDNSIASMLYHGAFTKVGRPTASLYVAPAVLLIQQGAYADALKTAQQIDAPEFTMYQVFLAALNAHLGLADQAEARADDIRRMHPLFSTYGRELIDRWSLPDDVTEKLITGLELAGISLD